ncbi:hypothetical protein PAAG_12252 [Paracoccidioides lutzii Pb01]|uniref:Uncharacterized protein n=1 Tax=Paracoccidioides lutzii (strain ATCC MYA-826 / Pb01) TaxID=502779 RepID=A0A0A2V0M9_PARBA|nr:hypothetical protein PAAG_12252 [Paracoccidioides lutzii Pb01]KGQ01058.1 hypothetical protein PAAG_12252 [Paracoccidioides lutzii Pb01]
MDTEQQKIIAYITPASIDQDGHYGRSLSWLRYRARGGFPTITRESGCGVKYEDDSLDSVDATGSGGNFESDCGRLGSGFQIDVCGQAERQRQKVVQEKFYLRTFFVGGLRI